MYFFPCHVYIISHSMYTCCKNGMMFFVGTDTSLVAMVITGEGNESLIRDTTTSDWASTPHHRQLITGKYPSCR